MLMLVTSDNLVQMFFGWEGVGLASYLLIGFWYDRPSAVAASMKAFIVNRVGDFGFAFGIFVVFVLTGTVNFDMIFAKIGTLAGMKIDFIGIEGRCIKPAGRWNARQFHAGSTRLAAGRRAMSALHSRTNCWLIGLVWALLATTGCQSFTAPKTWQMPWSQSKKEPEVPDRILAVWSDTVLHQPGEPGLRGFGGRLFFYLGDNKDPIEVDGGLAVYVFDADKLDPHAPSPERKFVFTADQFASHKSNSDLGCSYSIWIPWDEVGGPSQRLSLVARFEGRNGGTVISQPTIKLLPGTSHKVSIRQETSSTDHSLVPTEGSSLRQVGFDESPSPVATHRRSPEPNRSTPFTIDLPPSFYQRHLLGNASNADPTDSPVPPSMSSDSPPSEPRSAARGESTRDQESERSTPSIAPSTTRNSAGDRTRQREVTESSDPTDSRDERSPQPRISRFPHHSNPRSRNLRREPLPAGGMESLPQTPRR